MVEVVRRSIVAVGWAVVVVVWLVVVVVVAALLVDGGTFLAIEDAGQKPGGKKGNRYTGKKTFSKKEQMMFVRDLVEAASLLTTLPWHFLLSSSFPSSRDLGTCLADIDYVISKSFSILVFFFPHSRSPDNADPYPHHGPVKGCISSEQAGGGGGGGGGGVHLYYNGITIHCLP